VGRRGERKEEEGGVKRKKTLKEALVRIGTFQRRGV